MPRFLGPLDEVGDDQEVAAEAHLIDDADLEFEPIRILGELIAHPAQPELVESLSPSLTVALQGFDKLSLSGIRIVHGKPRGQAGPRVLGHHPRLALGVACQAGEDRLALGRRESAALGDDQRVGDGLGQVGERLLHDRGRLDPRFCARAGAVGGVDVGRMGDAEHGVVRGVKARLGELGRIAGDQRQIAGIGERDQTFLGRILHRIAAARQLDIEPACEQRLQPVAIGLGRARLAIGIEAGQSALAGAGQRDQAFAVAFEIGQRHVRIELGGPIEVVRG